MMPPVMGAGAFIMAEIVGVPYVQIIVAAAIPALLYYFALFWMIDFEAVNYNLKGILRDQLPNFWGRHQKQGLSIDTPPGAALLLDRAPGFAHSCSPRLHSIHSHRQYAEERI